MQDGADKDAGQSFFFAAPDGLNLHARIFGEDNGAAPVVCLPGLTRPARDFNSLASYLAARGRRVICIDYRGRGGSDWDPDWTRYSLPVEQADIAAMLLQMGIASAIFVGLSRGGIHAILLAATRPDLVKAMVLDDVGPVLEAAGLAQIKSYVGRLSLLRDFDEAVAHCKRLLGARFPALSDADWRVYAENTLVQTPERLRLSYDPQLARTLDSFDPTAPLPDLWAPFNAIKAPILALRGENSELLSPEVLAQMEAQNPNCQTHVVAGQGHAPMLLDEPTQKRIGDFIADAEQAQTVQSVL